MAWSPTYGALINTPGPLNAQEGARIVEYVAAGGLGQAPVLEVRAGLRSEQTEVAVLLCVSRELTARFFVWRARYGVNELGAFNKRVFTINQCPDEGEVAYFQSELGKELARGTRRQGKVLEQWIKDGELFFALVPGIVRQEVLEQVVAPDFPGGFDQEASTSRLCSQRSRPPARRLKILFIWLIVESSG